MGLPSIIAETTDRCCGVESYNCANAPHEVPLAFWRCPYSAGDASRAHYCAGDRVNSNKMRVTMARV